MSKQRRPGGPGIITPGQPQQIPLHFTSYDNGLVFHQLTEIMDSNGIQKVSVGGIPRELYLGTIIAMNNASDMTVAEAFDLSEKCQAEYLLRLQKRKKELMENVENKGTSDGTGATESGDPGDENESTGD